MNKAQKTKELEKDIFIAIGDSEHPDKFVGGKWYRWETRWDDLGRDLELLKKKVEEQDRLTARESQDGDSMRSFTYDDEAHEGREKK